MSWEMTELLDFCQTFEDLLLEGLAEDLGERPEPQHRHSWKMLGYDHKGCAVAICRTCGEIVEQ
jgi:hypothetical protein